MPSAEENCRQVEKMLRVRQLELRGATEGERAAAGNALDRLLTVFGAPDHAVARADLDGLQGRLDRAPRGARLTPRPAVQVRVVVVRSWGSTGTSTSTSTSSDWTNGGWW